MVAIGWCAIAGLAWAQEPWKAPAPQEEWRRRAEAIELEGARLAQLREAASSPEKGWASLEDALERSREAIQTQDEALGPWESGPWGSLSARVLDERLCAALQERCEAQRAAINAVEPMCACQPQMPAAAKQWRLWIAQPKAARKRIKQP